MTAFDLPGCRGAWTLFSSENNQNNSYNFCQPTFDSLGKKFHSYLTISRDNGTMVK